MLRGPALQPDVIMIAVSLLAFAVLASLQGTDGVPFLGGSFRDRATTDAVRPSRPTRQNRPDQLAQLPPSLDNGGFGGDRTVNQGIGNQGFLNQGVGGDDDDVFVFDQPTPSRPRPTPPRSTTRAIPTPQSPPSQVASGSTTANICVSSCPTTGEFNPVCGTDRVTYTNPGKLNCAVSCGRSVNLSHYGTCPTTTPSTTTTTRRP